MQNFLPETPSSLVFYVFLSTTSSSKPPHFSAESTLQECEEWSELMVQKGISAYRDAEGALMRLEKGFSDTESTDDDSSTSDGESHHDSDDDPNTTLGALQTPKIPILTEEEIQQRACYTARQSAKTLRIRPRVGLAREYHNLRGGFGQRTCGRGPLGPRSQGQAKTEPDGCDIHEPTPPKGGSE